MTKKIPQSARVFLTGGGSGLGRALALDFAAKRRARILIADVNAEGAADTAAAVRKAGGQAEVLLCDVADVKAVEGAAQRMADIWGGVDVVINNAGVAAGGHVGEQSLDDWRWIMDINLWGVIHGCHVFVPLLKAACQGWILNVASSAGIATLPEMASYNVTKAGVIALSETLYGELSRAGVQVSVLCPTFFKTNLMDTFRSHDVRQRKVAEAFFKRSRVTAEHVAATAVRGLEKGQLMIIPQADGKLMWRAKRLAYAQYYKNLVRAYSTGILDKLAGE